MQNRFKRKTEQFKEEESYWKDKLSYFRTPIDDQNSFKITSLKQIFHSVFSLPE